MPHAKVAKEFRESQKNGFGTNWIGNAGGKIGGKASKEVKLHNSPSNHSNRNGAIHSAFHKKGPLVDYDPKEQHWHIPGKKDRNITNAINALFESGYSKDKKELEALVCEFSEITGSHHNTLIAVTKIAEIHIERKNGEISIEKWFGKVKRVFKEAYPKHPDGNSLGFQALKQILGDANRGWLNGQYEPPEKFAVRQGDFRTIELFLTDPKRKKG